MSLNWGLPETLHPCALQSSIPLLLPEPLLRSKPPSCHVIQNLKLHRSLDQHKHHVVFALRSL